jgi:hypothetical protein
VLPPTPGSESGVGAPPPPPQDPGVKMWAPTCPPEDPGVGTRRHTHATVSEKTQSTQRSSSHNEPCLGAGIGALWNALVANQTLLAPSPVRPIMPHRAAIGDVTSLAECHCRAWCKRGWCLVCPKVPHALTQDMVRANRPPENECSTARAAHHPGLPTHAQAPTHHSHVRHGYLLRCPERYRNIEQIRR